MGFENMIRMFQQLKAEHVLHTAAIAIGYYDNGWRESTVFTCSMWKVALLAKY
jgi:hypothetical protein